MSTSSWLISTPIVGNPEFANVMAVGKPILPIPITHTLIPCFLTIRRISSKSIDMIFCVVFSSIQIHLDFH